MTKTMLTMLAVLSLSAPAAAATSGGKKPASVPALAPKEDEVFAKDDAIAFAERFVADQGYTGQLAKVSKDGVVKDPLDPTTSPEGVLQARRGSLEPKAAGARLESDLWFVGFRTTAGSRIRGLRMDAKGQGARFVGQNIQADWLAGKEPAPAPLTEAEAKAVASRFVAAQAVPGVAKESTRGEDHKPSDADGWDAWWFFFPKTGRKGAKPGAPSADFAVVSVHKLNRDPKWVSPEPSKVAVEPKKASPETKAAEPKKASPEPKKAAPGTKAGELKKPAATTKKPAAAPKKPTAPKKGGSR